MYSNTVMSNLEMLVMVVFLVLSLFMFNLRYWRARLINPMSCIYMLVIAGCVFEGFAFVADGHPDLIWLNYLSNILYLASIGLMSAAMLMYTNEQLPKKLWKTRRGMIPWMLPVTVEVLSLISAPWTHLIFYVDEAGCYHRASSFVIQMMAYLYLIITSTVGIYWYRRAQVKTERSLYLAIALFSIPPFLLGGIQLMLPANQLDVLEFSVALSLVANYATTQNNRITRDALTRLPNREILDVMIAEKIRGERRGETSQLYVMMADMDGFKGINDTYGHPEGDRALILTADALYDITSSYKGNVARYGGDEFTLLLETDDERTLQEMLWKIEERLAELSADLPYRLRISVGHTVYRHGNTVQDLLKAADQELYRVKKARKKGRQA